MIKRFKVSKLTSRKKNAMSQVNNSRDRSTYNNNMSIRSSRNINNINRVTAIATATRTAVATKTTLALKHQ